MKIWPRPGSLLAEGAVFKMYWLWYPACHAMYSVLGKEDEYDLDALESAEVPPDLVVALLGKIGSGGRLH